MGWSSNARGVRRVGVAFLVGVLVAGSAWASEVTEPGALTGDDGAPVAQAVAAELPPSPVVFSPDVVALTASAAESGAPVEVGRWEQGSVFAMPDGTQLVGLAAGPVHVARDTDGDGSAGGVFAEWVPLDTTLEHAPDGTVRTVATPGDITLSGGGAGASGPVDVAWMTAADGSRQALQFEGVLPAPRLEGSRAVYVDAGGAGTDLVVDVNSGGFRQFFVVRSLPQGQDTLEFPVGVASVGGTVRESGDGGLELLDSSQQVAGSFAEPVMWDRAADEEMLHPVTQPWVPLAGPTRPPFPDVAATPTPDAEGESPVATGAEEVEGDLASGDVGGLAGVVTEEPVETVVTGTGTDRAQVLLQPDMGFVRQALADGGVAVVDPDIHYGTGFDTWVQSDSTVDKSGDAELRLGTFDGSVVARSFLTFDTSPVRGRFVEAASLNLRAIHSYGCGAANQRGWEIWHTGAANSATRWGSQPAWLTLQLTSMETTGNQEYGCLDAWVDEPMTGAMRWAAERTASEISFGLKASNESDIYGWKKFASANSTAAPYLWVRLGNRAPNVPTGLSVSPAGETAGDVTWLPTVTPTLSATISDPDGDLVHAMFDVATQAGVLVHEQNALYWPSGSRVQITTPPLTDGAVYKARANSSDDQVESGYTPWLMFGVDSTKPQPPSITPVSMQTGVQAVYTSTGEAGGVGQTGKFTLTAGADASGVSAIWYGFDDPALSAPPAAPDANGRVTVPFTPKGAGPVTLYARAKDRAGNLSDVARYTFDVAEAVEDRTWLFDGTGAQEARVGGQAPMPLTISGGATWADGPHRLFGSRQTDQALVFDGVDDYAQTLGPVLDTSESYAVAARVWLNPEATQQLSYRTAVAQDGTTASAFLLQYGASCAVTGGDAGDGCWRLTLYTPDGSRHLGAVNSPVTVRAGQWVTLVGEVDTAQDLIRLWVCDAGTPQVPADGVPVLAEAPLTGDPLHASGPFTVGRAMFTGVRADFWPGRIGDVRVFSGEVVSTAKIRRLCQGAEASDFPGDTGPVALDPTVVETEVG